MSPNTKNTSTANKQPYCKVCHDAGKSESEYTTHWVKDLSGKTTCPTLLNTECRYCHKIGHTAKFCQSLAKNNKEKVKAERKTQLEEEKHKVQNKLNKSGLVVTNGFAALCYDSDSEEEIPEWNVYPTPLVSVEEKVVKEEIKEKIKTWASIVAKEVEKSPGHIFVKATNKLYGIHRPQPIIADWVTKAVSDSLQKYPTKRWADCTDSEDDDDDVEDETW